jgi:hypothetical protein
MQRYSMYDSSGAATTVVRAPGNVDARRCAALAQVHGVTAAVAIRPLPAELRVAALPRFGQPQVEVLGDLLGVLGGTGGGTPGVFISDGFASQLGLDADAPLALLDTTSRVSGVFTYPEDGRLQLLANAVVVPTIDATDPFDECWVRVWPPDERLSALLTTLVVGGQSSATEYQQLNGTLGVPHPLSRLLAESQVTTVKLAAAAVAMMVGIAWVRIRRLDLAGALHVGQSRLAQLAQLLLAAAPIGVVSGAAVGVVTVVAVSLTTPSISIGPIVTSSLLTSAALLGSFFAGVVISHATIKATKFGDWSKDR